MAIKNTLLMAVAFIAVLATALIIFGHDETHMGMAEIITDDVESINKARHLFWSGDINKAEKLYQDVTENSTGNINAWGELGNVYYIQAKWPQAAKAYAEVALQLIEINDLRQADYYHRLVSRMDREQTERINERLRQLHKATQKES